MMIVGILFFGWRLAQSLSAISPQSAARPASPHAGEQGHAHDRKHNYFPFHTHSFLGSGRGRSFPPDARRAAAGGWAVRTALLTRLRSEPGSVLFLVLFLVLFRLVQVVSSPAVAFAGHLLHLIGKIDAATTSRIPRCRLPGDGIHRFALFMGCFFVGSGFADPSCQCASAAPANRATWAISCSRLACPFAISGHSRCSEDCAAQKKTH